MAGNGAVYTAASPVGWLLLLPVPLFLRIDP